MYGQSDWSYTNRKAAADSGQEKFEKGTIIFNMIERYLLYEFLAYIMDTQYSHGDEKSRERNVRKCGRRLVV